MTPLLLSYAGYAASIAAAIVAGCWIAEMLIGRRLGFYLNGAACVAVVLTCSFFLYATVSECVLVNNAPFPRCEYAPAFLWLVASTTLAALLPLTISAVILRLRPHRQLKHSA